MAEKEQESPAVQSAIDKGYRVAATVFCSLMDVLEERYGKQEAREIARKVIRRKGQILGEAAAQRFGKGGLEKLAAYHKDGYAGVRVLELTPTRYVFCEGHCRIADGWRTLKLSPERIKELGDSYCWGDLYFAQVFHPDIRLEFEGRQVEGQSECKWVYTLDESARETASRAEGGD